MYQLKHYQKNLMSNILNLKDSHKDIYLSPSMRDIF